MSARDTIFALSSGPPPAAIAVIRISGPAATETLAALAGRLPPPRRAALRTLRNGEGAALDQALTLLFPGPDTATGEDLVELHLHGGRAVVAAVLAALSARPGLRAAEAGEFTRRAFDNGRLDLSEVEGLSDLLAAETEQQRRAALSLADGHLRRRAEAWRTRVVALSAQLEAVLAFPDEGDVGDALPASWRSELARLAAEVAEQCDAPRVERLRDGIRVSIAGPANAGKSSLFNALIGRDAAITSPVAGTTRDIVEATVAFDGLPFVLMDTAGLRDTDDAIEAVGIERARQSVDSADITLWLGDRVDCPATSEVILVQTRMDLHPPRDYADARVSSVTGVGIPDLIEVLKRRADALTPKMPETAINRRQHGHLVKCRDALAAASIETDEVLCAEALQAARAALDALGGHTGLEEMLDALFAGFCIGK